MEFPATANYRKTKLQFTSWRAALMLDYSGKKSERSMQRQAKLCLPIIATQCIKSVMKLKLLEGGTQF